MFENKQEYLLWLDALSDGERAAVHIATVYFVRIQMQTALYCLEGTRDDQVNALKDIVQTQQVLLEEATAHERAVGA